MVIDGTAAGRSGRAIAAAAAICIPRGDDGSRTADRGPNGECTAKRVLAIYSATCFGDDTISPPPPGIISAKMARAGGDVSRIVCANTIQQNDRRLREARIKNQVYRARRRRPTFAVCVSPVCRVPFARANDGAVSVLFTSLLLDIRALCISAIMQYRYSRAHLLVRLYFLPGEGPN